MFTQDVLTNYTRLNNIHLKVKALLSAYHPILTPAYFKF